MKRSILVKGFIYSLLSLSLISCGGSKSNQSKSFSLPSWFLNTPNNTNEVLYGAGESESLEDAKKEALKNISEKLLVTLKSSYTSNTKTSTDGINDSYLKENIRNIETKTKQIDYSNYKTLKAIQGANRFYTLVSVNKQELFSNQKTKLEANDKKIDMMLNSLDNKSKLSQIKAIKSEKQTLKDAKDLALILNAIDGNFDYVSYHQKYDGITAKIDSLKDEMIIRVNSNTNALYKEHLKSLLNKNNYKVSSSNANVFIDISNNIRESNYKGWDIAKVASTVNVKANGKTISNHTINTVGRSSSSKANALVDSAKKFNKKINQLGLDKLLYATQD